MKKISELNALLADKKEPLCNKLSTLSVFIGCNDSNISRNHSQYIVNWLCTNLEFVTNAEIYITENEDMIKEILCTFEKQVSLCCNINQELYIKPTIHEVFVKLLKHWKKTSHVDNVVSALVTLLKHEPSRKHLLMKQTLIVDLLSLMLDGWQGKEDLNLNTCAAEYLLELHLKYLKNNLHSKKTTGLFCQHLLNHVLTVYGYCQHHHSKSYDKLCSSFEQVLMLHLSSREILSGIKAQLKSTDDQPEKKKIKTDKSTDLLDKLSSYQIKHNISILKSLPVVYKYLIDGSRKSNNFLTAHEEFLLLVKLVEIFELENLIASEISLVVNTYNEVFNIVINENIYQPVQDKANNRAFENWMKHCVQKLIALLQESGKQEKCQIFNVLKTILCTSHLVIKDDMQEIIRNCISSNDGDKLLCEILATYSKLNQLASLMDYFVIDIQSTNEIHFSTTFYDKFSQAVSMLEISQVSNILKLFLKRFKENQITVLSVYQIHFAYVWCYLPILHASVIPESGYLKADHNEFLDVMKSLKKELDDKVTSNPKQQYFVNASYMVKLAINKIYLLLREYHLVNENFEEMMTLSIPNNFQTNFLSKYLEISFLFDQLLLQGYEDKLIDNVVKIINENEILYLSIWSGNLPSIDKETFGSAIVEFLKCNQSLVLCLNNEKLLTSYTRLLFNKIENEIHCRGFWKRHEQLQCFNNKLFQTCLLKTMWEAFNKTIVIDSDLNVSKLSTCDIQSFADVFKSTIEKTGKTKIKDFDKLSSLLKILGDLPISYFDQRKLDCLYLLSSNILNASKNKHTKDITQHIIYLHGKIIEGTLLWQPKVCLLPLDKMFLFVVDNYMHIVDKDFENFIILWTHAYIKLGTAKEENHIFEKLKHLIQDSSNQQLGLKTCYLICYHACELFRETVIRPRMESNILLVTRQISSIIPTPKNSEDLSLDSFLLIFSKLCHIVSIAQKKELKKDEVTLLCDDLLSEFENITSVVESRLLATNTTKMQHFEVIKSIYCDTTEFNLRMRSLFLEESTVLQYTCAVIETYPNHDDLKHLNDIIIGIIINLPNNKLKNALELMVEKFVDAMHCGNFRFVSSWINLLNSKWTKEQRIILWDVLPKVLIGASDQLKNEKDVDHIKILLDMLICCINISKNSVMSQYITYIYHVFSILDNNLVPRSDVYFDKLYTLASQMLFHHNATVYNSLPTFLNVVQSLFRHLVYYTSENIMVSESHLTNCCENMSRLYQEIGGHKNNINKYAPFLVNIYLQSIQNGSFTRNQKKILDGGIFCVLATFTEFQYAMMSTLVDNNTREIFRSLKHEYDNFHKFKG